MPHEARVSLSFELPHRLRSLAVAAAPREFVALLAGPASRVDGAASRGTLVVDHVLPLANTATALDRFEVAPHTFAAAEATLGDQGRRWLGFVHSHPVGRATLSAIDRQRLWPHCLQLVLGLAASSAQDAWLGAFRGDGTDWYEVPIEVASATTAVPAREPA